MKFLIAIVLFSSSLSSAPTNIVIQIGDFKFPVEKVVQLKPLMDNSTSKAQFSSYINVVTLCSSADLPQEFQSICDKSDAPHIFDTLKHIAAYPYPCMICAYAFCTGCD